MKVLLLLALTLVTGCAYFTPAGVADYTMEPIIVEGTQYCCKVTVLNTKDIGMVEMEFSVEPDGAIKVTLTELEVSSSNPAIIQAETTNSLVNHLIKLGPVIE